MLAAAVADQIAKTIQALMGAGVLAVLEAACLAILNLQQVEKQTQVVVEVGAETQILETEQAMAALGL
jgi:hypothetical protein